MKTSLVSSVYRRNSILPTFKTDLPIFKTIGFREENKRQKFFTISKTGKLKTEPLSTTHKSNIPSKSSQNRWGLCNIAKLNLIGKVEGLQRDLRLFFFYGVGDLDCRICICLRKIV